MVTVTLNGKGVMRGVKIDRVGHFVGVAQADLDRVALGGADHRTGHGPVESPGPHPHAGGDLDPLVLGHQVDPDDVGGGMLRVGREDARQRQDHHHHEQTRGPGARVHVGLYPVHICVDFPTVELEKCQ